MNPPKTFESCPAIQLQEAQLREFIATSSGTRIQAAGKAHGFELHIDIGPALGVLRNSRGAVRTFSSLDALASLVHRLGVDQFNVVIGEFANYDAPTSAPPAKKSSIAATASSRSKASSV